MYILTVFELFTYMNALMYWYRGSTADQIFVPILLTLQRKDLNFHGLLNF
jgi:hypothetical protein